MEIVVYIGMQKDVNSTAIPIGVGQGVGGYESAITYPCEVFEPCSVLNPIVKIEPLAAFLENTIKRANYAYIADYGRYYWINDIHYEKGFWFLHLNVDVLASWRTAIGNSTQYVLRSQSRYDLHITDTLYPPTGGKEIRTSERESPFPSIFEAGITVLGISGNAQADTSIGSTTYYAFSYSMLQSFMNMLWNNDTWLNLTDTDLQGEVAKVILNPLQYIQSCKWFPIVPDSLGMAVSEIKFGWWSLPANAGLILYNNPVLLQTTSVTLSTHPQSGRGYYLMREPYTKYTIELPGVGVMDLPTSYIDPTANLVVTAHYTVDTITGTAKVDLYQFDPNFTTENKEHWIYTTNCDMAIDIPLAQIARDVVGAGSSAVGGLAGGFGQILSGNIIGGIASLVDGAIGAVTQAETPIVSFMGQAGNFATFRRKPTCHSIFQRIAPDATELFGKPLCELVQINTLSGFVMCGRAHMLIPGAMAQETERIEAYLNGGFRYE